MLVPTSTERANVSKHQRRLYMSDRTKTQAPHVRDAFTEPRSTVSEIAVLVLDSQKGQQMYTEFF